MPAARFLGHAGVDALCQQQSGRPAVQALRTRLGDQVGEEEEASLRERIFDGSDELLPQDDGELPADTAEPAVRALIQQAERLLGESGDPTLALLTEPSQGLIRDGFAPVGFCRYIATAHYLH